MFYYLSLAIALFAIGIFGILTRKGIVGKLVALFLMTNAVILLFATFSHYIQTDGLIGPVYISFILLAIISELLLGAFIVYRCFADSHSSDEESIDMFN